MKSSEHRRAEIITILNLKGGVGKTHSAWLLAGVCEERGLNREPDVSKVRIVAV